MIPKNNEMPQPILMFMMIVLGIILRSFVSSTKAAAQLKQYPHFTTPLNDMRELRETFFTYEKWGTISASPSQIGQSELLVKLLYYVNSNDALDEQGLWLCIALFDTVSMLIQLIIFGVVFSQTQKKEKYTLMALCWIVFNPISLIGGFSNLGALNDAIFYLVALWPLLDEEGIRHPAVMAILNTVATYFDPRVIFLMIPLSVMQARYSIGHSNRKGSNTLKETLVRVVVTYMPILLMFFCVSRTELKNIKNILLVNNPVENLGNFWYLMHEMFLDRLDFFKYIYLIMNASACIFISIQLYKAADMIDHVIEGQVLVEKTMEGQIRVVEKSLRRHKRLYMAGLLLLSYVKFIMNPYPNLHDFSFVVFFTLMSITLVLHYVEGFFFMTAGLFFAIANSGLLWITWLKRFSGNANFFYFQTIVFNAFMVLLYLQVFIAVDQKRKKYARELVAMHDKVQEAKASNKKQKVESQQKLEQKQSVVQPEESKIQTKGAQTPQKAGSKKKKK